MKKVWFITGSQHLYGPETLKEVADHVNEMVEFLNTKEEIICEIANKGTLTTPDEITEMLSNAQNDKDWIYVNILDTIFFVFTHIFTQIL